MSSARSLCVAAFALSALACTGSHSRGPDEVASPGSGNGGGPDRHVLDEAGSGGAGAGQSGTLPSAGSAASAGSGDARAGQSGTLPSAGSSAGAGSTGTAAGGAGAGGMPGPRGIAAMDASPVVPEFADTGVGMWVGQFWSSMPTLCDPNGVPDEGPMKTPEGHRVRVVLILDSDGEELEGRIAFGEGDLSGLPGYVPGGNHNPFVGCSNYRPAIGGVYEVRSAVQREARLTFEIAPNEIWNGWCQREPFFCEPSSCLGVRGCICDGDVCRADVTQRLLIDLTASPDELEGVTIFGELRLRRVQ